MFDIRWMLILVPALPLVSTLLLALAGARVIRQQSHWITIAGLAASFVCSLVVAAHVVQQTRNLAPGESYERVETVWTWMNIPEAATLSTGSLVPFHIDVTLRADGLTAVMLPMVTFIATLVSIYASGYMHGDRGYWRFFCYVSLFVFSMTMLVMVSNFLLLFVFWEAVGLCSYVLIGFWYSKPEAVAAGKKAFLVNRVGDFGFVIALFLIWIHYGTLNYHDTPEVPGVFGVLRTSGQWGYVSGGVATAIGILLMLGACGKSAQFPLHVWLPDAMEGPTPVSALIHAATMVTAGVYMVARCAPLFQMSSDAQIVVACLGGFTALLAGLIALTQFDLKRVLAYSTVSQLGYMFLALGTGTVSGITAAMFHLFTHAFFKALLFLGAGSVMHAMGNVVDMRRFGGLRHVLPWTHRTFLVGSLALAGIFPFAGFWSKDQILASVHAQTHLHAEAAHGGTTTITAPRDATRNVAALSRASSAASTGSTNWVPAEYRASIFRVLYSSSLFTAFLTAFYTFRAYYLTFFGPLVIPSEAGHHAHESPPRMWGPLVVLAVFAFGIGFVWELNDVFSHFLSTTPSMAHLVRLHGAAEAEFHMNIALLSTVVALIGIGFASFYYLGDRREIARLAQRLGWLRLLSYHKFFVDELYQILFVWPLQGIGRLSYFVDRRLIDGVVDLTGCLPVWLGAGARRWQTGLVPFYGLMMATGMVVILVLGGWFWWGG